MADGTAIEWTDATWNPITGCSVLSAGCTNCYAMRLAGTRLKHHPSRAGLTIDGKAGPVWNGEVRLNEGWLDQPLRWSRPRTIFVCAHGDLFHPAVPDAWLDQVFDVMENRRVRHHRFQVLTKRANRLRDYLRRRWQVPGVADLYGLPDGAMVYQPFKHIWLGVSVEDQRAADERIPALIDTPAFTRFLSCEPLLGPLDLVEPLWLDWIDWVIAGGESGLGARPMHPAWVRDLRDQCAGAAKPFFFKQWGAWIDGGKRIAQMGTVALRLGAPQQLAWPDGTITSTGRAEDHGGPAAWLRNVGKTEAGRLLDGVEHLAMPEVA